MSTRAQARRPTSRWRLAEGGSSGRLKMVRDLDLNRHPDVASASSADALLQLHAEPPLPQPVVAQQPPPPPPTNNGNDAIIIPDEDDDLVLLSSSTTAIRQVRRAPPSVPVIFLDEDSDVQQDHPDSAQLRDWLSLRSDSIPERNRIDSRPERNPRKRAIIHVEEYESKNDFPRAKATETMQLQVLEAPPPPPPPKEPVFNCSVCLGELDEATSTICGHIFCHKCIKASIQAQKKCPTCRKTLSMKNIHRVYLPTTK